MAETYKILGKKASANTAERVLYSTSEGTEAILTNITVANRSAESKTFNINIVDEALTDNDLVGQSGTATVVMHQAKTTGSGESDLVKFSTDQITWTSGTLPRADYWKDFNYIANNYVAFNYDMMTNSVDYAVSTDALTWTLNSLPGGGTGYGMSNGGAKKINNSLIIYPGPDLNAFAGLSSIFTTTDLITWNTRTLPNPNSWSFAYLRGLSYGNGIYFGIGAELSAYYSSTDSITWTHSTSLPTACNFSNCFYVNGNFVAYGVDDQYTNNLLFTTTDAVTWTQSMMAPSIFKVASNGSIALAYNDNSMFSTTTDGLTWDGVMVPFIGAIESVYETDLSCNGDTFIFSINSTGGMTTPATSYYTSTDAVNWSTVAIADTSLFSLNFNRFSASYNEEYLTNQVHSLYKNVTIPANTSKVLEPGVVLGSENSVLIKGSSDLTFSAYGVELS
jgi:hypothetical protein